MDVISYIDSKHIDYKREGNEILIVCPNCGKSKLSININSGLYQCWHCQAEDPGSFYAKGHLSALQEQWGDLVAIKPVAARIESPLKKEEKVDYSSIVEECHKALLNNKSGLRYLFNRGITEESIKRFKLGFVNKFNQDCLVIPSFEKGIPKLLKYRKLPPDTNTDLPKYIREKGSSSILFNGDVVETNDEVIILEGEIDTITLLQNGYENAVGMTGGAGTLKPEWYDVLKEKSKIYLVLDNDPAGQGAAKDVWAARLGLSRCYNVLLPEDMDINEYFKEHSKEDFNKLLDSAQRFKVDGVVSLGDALYQMYLESQDDSNIIKYATPWENVNKLINGGFQKKDLIVLGGAPGTGKTSFALQLAYVFAKQHDMPILNFCVEMGTSSLATKIVQLDRDLAIQEVHYSDALIYAMDLADLPLYLGFAVNIKPEVVANTIREARNRYGIKLAIFDNLHALIRSDKESDIANVSKMFKALTMELDIPIILISQPRKLNSENTPTYDDLKGSSAIPADADIVILLHRIRDTKPDGSTSLVPETSVIVDKARLATGGRTRLKFLGEKSRFIEEEKKGEVNG
jgi:KaiC/GvpD/RAD55 family RecA-like ATPase